MPVIEKEKITAYNAKKCNISEDELRADADKLMRIFDDMSVEESNRFTEDDVQCALNMYNENFVTFPRDDIGKLCAMSMPVNRRNYRNQSLHLQMAMTAGVLGGCGNSAANNAKTETNAQNNAGTAETNEDASADATETAGADGTVYKVGIVQYVDDASLNQIEKAIEAELDAKGAELGVTFDYADYTYNGQADSSTLNQIATDLVAEKVDVIIPIATPAAMIMQNATEDNQIPVVFSAVSDPVSAGLVADLNAPGANITGTSDALDTTAVMKLITAANPGIQEARPALPFQDHAHVQYRLLPE